MEEDQTGATVVRSLEALEAAVRDLANVMRPAAVPPPVKHAGGVYDLAGRQVPHKLGLCAWLQGIPGLAAQFEKRVPETYLSRSTVGDVRVNCPCGTVTLIGPTFTNCLGSCGRVFLDAGESVRVAGPYPQDDEPLRCDMDAA